MKYNRFLGYTKGEDGKLEIVPEEAEVVKRIYRQYLEAEAPSASQKDSSMMVLKPGTGKQNGTEQLYKKSFPT